MAFIASRAEFGRNDAGFAFYCFAARVRAAVTWRRGASGTVGPRRVSGRMRRRAFGRGEKKPAGGHPRGRQRLAAEGDQPQQ